MPVLHALAPHRDVVVQVVAVLAQTWDLMETIQMRMPRPPASATCRQSASPMFYGEGPACAYNAPALMCVVSCLRFLTACPPRLRNRALSCLLQVLHLFQVLRLWCACVFL